MKKKLVILLLLIGKISTYGCSCLTPSLDIAIEKYEVIFIGRLIEHIDSSKLYTPGANYNSQQLKFHNFEVIKYCKGLEFLDTIVSIFDGGNNCDFPFRAFNIGDTFLIYAFHKNMSYEHSFLGTHQCTRTVFLSNISDKYEKDFVKSKRFWGLEWNSPKRNKPSLIKSESKSKFDFTPSFNSIVLIVLAINLTLNLIILFKLGNKK